MSKRILLGMHNLSERALYEEILAVNGDVLISDPNRGLIGLLDDIARIRPDSVLMDANYPVKNGNSFESFRRTYLLMQELGYDPKKSLIGVTGNDKLVKGAGEEGYKLILKGLHFPEFN